MNCRYKKLFVKVTLSLDFLTNIDFGFETLTSMNDSTLTISGDLVKSMKMVAEGNFSQVYFAETATGKTAAVKKVKKSVKDKTSYELAKKEAEILNGLESALVSRLLGTYEEHNYFYLIERFQ